MKPPAGLRACWVPVGGQAHATPWDAPLPDASDATVMGTLLASQGVHRPAKSGTLVSGRPGQSMSLGRSQPRVRNIPPRRCACGALLFVRFSPPSSSVPGTLVLHVHRVRA